MIQPTSRVANHWAEPFPERFLCTYCWSSILEYFLSLSISEQIVFYFEASSHRYFQDTSSWTFELPAESMGWDLLRIIWLYGDGLLIGRPAGHAFFGQEQSNEPCKNGRKMNCCHLIFTLEANTFMVSAASVDDKTIKFLQIKILSKYPHQIFSKVKKFWVLLKNRDGKISLCNAMSRVFAYFSATCYRSCKEWCQIKDFSFYFWFICLKCCKRLFECVFFPNTPEQKISVYFTAKQHSTV